MTFNIYKSYKYLVILIIMFIIYLYLYTQVDLIGNRSYQFSSGLLLVLNTGLNIIMSMIAGHSTTLVYYQYKLTNKESNASIFAPLSLIFGMLTYGCSSCTIALLSTVGLSYSVKILPFDNLPYKFLALGIIIVGYMIVRRNFIKGCKIKL